MVVIMMGWIQYLDFTMISNRLKFNISNCFYLYKLVHYQKAKSKYV